MDLKYWFYTYKTNQPITFFSMQLYLTCQELE